MSQNDCIVAQTISVLVVEKTFASPGFEARDALGNSHDIGLGVCFVFLDPNFRAKTEGYNDSHDTSCDRRGWISMCSVKPECIEQLTKKDCIGTTCRSQLVDTYRSSVLCKQGIENTQFEGDSYACILPCLDFTRSGRRKSGIRLSRNYLMAYTVDGLQGGLDCQLQTAYISQCLGVLSTSQLWTS